MAGTITGVKTRSRGVTKIAATFVSDAATGDTPRVKIGSAWGKITAIEYDPATGGVATGADITLSDALGAPIIVLTDAGTTARRFRPTNQITTNAGVAIAAAATATNTDRDIFVAGDLYLQVVQAGNSKTGKFNVIVEEGGLSD